MSQLAGFVLLDKPEGITSFAALSPVKRILGTGKVGHAGTLDRFATGLLVIFVGAYTRLVPWASGSRKRYQAVIHFGEETDTLDPEGSVVFSGPVPERTHVESILPDFTGLILQQPPVWSSLHINGKRAYERALAGENPVMKPRPVTVYSLKIVAWQENTAVVDVECSQGTYIRSLARDIALAAGSRAHLVQLRRLLIGPFKVEDAVYPESFNPGTHLLSFTPKHAHDMNISSLVLSDKLVSQFFNGRQLRTSLVLNTSTDYTQVTKVVTSTSLVEKDALSLETAVFTSAGEFAGIIDISGETIIYKFVTGLAR